MFWLVLCRSSGRTAARQLAAETTGEVREIRCRERLSFPCCRGWLGPPPSHSCSHRVQTTPPSSPPLLYFIQISPYPSELDRSGLSSTLLDSIGQCAPGQRLVDPAWGRSHDRVRPTTPCARRAPVSRSPSAPGRPGTPTPAAPDLASQRLEGPTRRSCLNTENQPLSPPPFPTSLCRPSSSVF